MPLEEILSRIGLSDNEIKIYTQLLRGRCTVTELSSLCRIHRANVYDTIRRLMKKGLVAKIVDGKKTLFVGSDPKNIVNILEEEKSELESLLPHIKLSTNTQENDVRLFTDVQAAKNTLKELLDYNKPIYVVGTPPKIADSAKSFLIGFHRERIKRKIPIYHCYSREADKDFIDVGVHEMKFTFSKHLPNGLVIPMSTTICGDQVQLKFWKKNSIVIVIKSQEVADVYKRYFDLFWNLSKPINWKDVVAKVKSSY